MKKRLLGLILSILIGFSCIPVDCLEAEAASVTLHNPKRAANGTVTWDCVWFGNYWQNDTNGDGTADVNDNKEAIKWRVLSVDGDTAFLLADQGLDSKDYNTETMDVTWETCTLRSWLNRDFLGNAFSQAEQGAIRTTTVVNDDNPELATEGGNNTQDRLFLLSIAEASNSAYGFDATLERYDKARRAKPTAFARTNGASINGDPDGSYYGNGHWFLRSPGCYSGAASAVYEEGCGSYAGGDVSCPGFLVRPALRLNLSSSLFSYAGTVSSGGTTTPAPNKKVAVKKITISGISQKIAAGKKVSLSATVTPKNATNKQVTWTSSNKKYATVDNKGVVTTKKNGIGKNVTITAKAKDGSGKKATYKIKIVKHAVKSIKLSAKQKTVKAGKNLKLKATVKTTGKTANKTLKWTTSNSKYATVNSKGVVTAKKAGKKKTVTITAQATDGTGKKATMKIKIK